MILGRAGVKDEPEIGDLTTRSRQASSRGSGIRRRFGRQVVIRQRHSSHDRLTAHQDPVSIHENDPRYLTLCHWEPPRRMEASSRSACSVFDGNGRCGGIDRESSTPSRTGKEGDLTGAERPGHHCGAGDAPSFGGVRTAGTARRAHSGFRRARPSSAMAPTLPPGGAGGGDPVAVGRRGDGGCGRARPVAVA